MVFPGPAQEFRGDQQNVAEVSQWALARAQALSEQAGLRVAWMRGQVGPHMSPVERLTLAEAVATQVLMWRHLWQSGQGDHVRRDVSGPGHSQVQTSCIRLPSMYRGKVSCTRRGAPASLQS